MFVSLSCCKLYLSMFYYNFQTNVICDRSRFRHEIALIPKICHQKMVSAHIQDCFIFGSKWYSKNVLQMNIMWCTYLKNCSYIKHTAKTLCGLSQCSEFKVEILGEIFLWRGGLTSLAKQTAWNSTDKFSQPQIPAHESSLQTFISPELPPLSDTGTIHNQETRFWFLLRGQQTITIQESCCLAF